MKLHELSPAAGSTKEAYRKGRGAGSGNGKTGGRGHKGQKARSVNAEALLAKGILNKCEYGYKVLGNGKVTKKVNVEASAFSASAKEAIEAAGGKAEVI